MTTVVFEFPMKEKVRNYLRVEHILKQISTAGGSDCESQHLYFFEQLFTLIDLFERLDLRTDLVKDLDLYEKHLKHWANHPNIDKDALQSTLDTTINIAKTLKISKKFCSDIKDDKFLASIKQRFSIPGGTCSFDLPNLHYWLLSANEQKHQDITKWLASLALLRDTIALVLGFIRQRGKFQPITADNGFYQGVADSLTELIRIEFDNQHGYYPTMSGNRYRYAIRFAWLDNNDNRDSKDSGTTYVEQSIDFRFASC